MLFGHVIFFAAAAAALPVATEKYWLTTIFASLASSSYKTFMMQADILFLIWFLYCPLQVWRWQSGECTVMQGHKEQVRRFLLLCDSAPDAKLLSWSFDGSVKVKPRNSCNAPFDAWMAPSNHLCLCFLSLLSAVGRGERPEAAGRRSSSGSHSVMPRLPRRTPLLHYLCWQDGKGSPLTHWCEASVFVLPVATWPITHWHLCLANPLLKWWFTAGAC